MGAGASTLEHSNGGPHYSQQADDYLQHLMKEAEAHVTSILQQPVPQRGSTPSSSSSYPALYIGGEDNLTGYGDDEEEGEEDNKDEDGPVDYSTLLMARSQARRILEQEEYMDDDDEYLQSLNLREMEAVYKSMLGRGGMTQESLQQRARRAREQQEAADDALYNTMRETQSEMMVMLGLAMRAASSSPTTTRPMRPTLPTQRAATGPAAVQYIDQLVGHVGGHVSAQVRASRHTTLPPTHTDHLVNWDADVSSPFLQYSPQDGTGRTTAGYPRGLLASTPNACAVVPACPFSFRTKLTLVLDAAPFRPGFLSIGITEMDNVPPTGVDLFGKQVGWGIVSRRDSMLPTEAWAGARKQAVACRALAAGDVVCIDLNQRDGFADFFLNDNRVARFDLHSTGGGAGAGAGVTYLLGVTLCQDHTCTIMRSGDTEAARAATSTARMHMDDLNDGLFDDIGSDYLPRLTYFNRHEAPGSGGGGSGVSADNGAGGGRRFGDIEPTPTPDIAPPPGPSIAQIARSSPFVALARDRGAEIESAPPSSGSSALDCCVCLSSAKSVVFLPCKHLCCCTKCGLDSGLLTCPMCRAPIARRLDVFL